MKPGQLPSTRLYHRAHLVSMKGVSALCFKRPRLINMKVATWTTSDEAVTCRKCLALMKPKAASPVQADLPLKRSSGIDGPGEGCP